MDEIQIAKIIFQYCKDLVKKQEIKEFDDDYMMTIGIICGLLTTLNKEDNKEKMQKDIIEYALNIVKEIFDNYSLKIKNN